MGAGQTKPCTPTFPQLWPLRKIFQTHGLADTFPRIYFFVWRDKFLVIVTAKAIVSVIIIELKGYKCIATYSIDISSLDLLNLDCIFIQDNRIVLTDYLRRIALFDVLTGKEYLIITNIETDQFDMTYKLMVLDDCRFVCISNSFEYTDCFIVIPNGAQGKECIRLPDKKDISDVYCHQERFIILFGCRTAERNFMYVYDFTKRIWLMRVASPLSYLYRSVLSSKSTGRFIIFASKYYGGKHKIMLWESVNEQSLQQRSAVDVKDAPSDILNFSLAKNDSFLLYTTFGQVFLHNWLSVDISESAQTQKIIDSDHMVSSWYSIYKDFLFTYSPPYLKFYKVT